MSFGNFLLGVAEGLDRGVEAGDRISRAWDNKQARKKAKEEAAKNPAPATASTG